ncbi:Na+:H+ antiporter, NhaA family [Nocardioides alpinus]|uniref:Na(+)/H(+) antiporter NhaA n=1 Tax=Nocardioides alpinus TaxID=748909 RepID=A0A1I0ZCJ5_9ACTN|nr:Na+/H+ antiporter NhaA [Nocardioides alpinus]PKH40750.1 Na+/H+ antiporter NhaA [Nocardioides alpinus]SFB22270.1 Na+:H+ antiporter, NhaA family [Nocardioides alpinus]
MASRSKNPHDDPRNNGGDDLWESGPSYIASNKPLARLVARPVREFLRVEAAGSLLLLLAAAVALLWANSPWAESYDALWHTHLVLDVGPLHLDESLQHWVNDALMVIFFFVVGLEIKYELVNGDLRDPKTAALPIIAAVGGMVVPAGLYLALNPPGSAGGDGWGIPMATDIAFAVGVLGILGRRIPSAARLFLLTLAIVDDIGAILVIAVFYTADLSLVWLAIAFALLGAMVVARLLRVWTVVVYAILGVGVWFALLESGVHATLAGVAIGLLAPATPLLKEEVARRHARAALRDNVLDPDELARQRFLLKESVSVVERLQSTLHPVSAYVVLPVFALANAGVELGAIGKVFTEPVGLGIILGLVVGKPVGILAASFLAVRLGLGRLPDHTTWPMVLGLGAVGGIGFTVSIFIAGLSFPGSDLLTEEAKIAILLASLFAAVVGVVLLLAATRASEDTAEESADAAQPLG